LTLLESERRQDRETAQALLVRLAPHRIDSLRIGITGPPGVGKSTFIDTLGSDLVRQGQRVAVLAIDPSSTVSGGSILGDKTRMQQLSTHPLSFIRPSPSSGKLGGVTPSIRNSIQLCEAAGYGIIFLETVGVGQSETAVRNLCDVLVLLTMVHSGDELQGIKRGLMEAVDLVLINKCDQLEQAEWLAYQESLRYAVHLLGSRPNGADAAVLSVSSISDKGMEQVWAAIADYARSLKSTGAWNAQRAEQQVMAFKSAVEEKIAQKAQELLATAMRQYENAVRESKITPDQAAEELMKGVWK
jgi:LAO/AO transport system kinase